MSHLLTVLSSYLQGILGCLVSLLHTHTHLIPGRHSYTENILSLIPISRRLDSRTVARIFSTGDRYWSWDRSLVLRAELIPEVGAELEPEVGYGAERWKLCVEQNSLILLLKIYVHYMEYLGFYYFWDYFFLQRFSLQRAFSVGVARYIKHISYSSSENA